MTLELKGVVKRLGAETHIHETSVRLVEGGFNIFLGTTLAGKTTLMQLMAGLERPSAGEVWFNGVNVTGVPVQKRNVSMVYQQFINYPHLTVFVWLMQLLAVVGVRENFNFTSRHVSPCNTGQHCKTVSAFASQQPPFAVE